MKFLNKIVVLMLLLTGCAEDYIGTYFITNDSIKLNYKGYASVVDIEGNSTNWIAECEETWISLSQNGTELTVGASINFTEADRFGDIIIKYRGECLDTIHVVQLAFATEIISVESAGNTISYDFPTTEIDSLSCESDWITMHYAFNKITVEIEANNCLEPREAFIDVFIGGVSHRIIEVRQSNASLTLDDLMLVEVSGGTYLQGAQSFDIEDDGFDPDATSIESPVHIVTLDSFMMGKYEVSQRIWHLVMGYNNSSMKDDNMPVTNVTYDEIMIFLAKLSAHVNKPFRLPTEWEWEYAAKERKSSGFSMYSGSNDIDDVAWYYSNSFKMLNYIGLKIPNALGLYDMTGNVMEICDGYYIAYTEEEKINPRVENGSLRVTKGGAWNSQRTNCRTTYRYCINESSCGDNIGFRIVLAE